VAEDQLHEARPARANAHQPAANIRPDRVRDDFWYRISVPLARAFMWLILRLRFEGLENVPDSGGAILAPNHVSVLDPVVIALGVARRGRTLRFLAASEFFERGRHVVAFGLRRFRQIPVRRGLADWTALNDIAGVIHAGSLAGIFPEGRVGDGALQRGQKGLARVAMAAGVPVLPVAIWGTQRRWPRGGFRWFVRRPVVRVVIGAPIQVGGDPRDRPQVRALTDQIMREIEALLPRARGEAAVAGSP
jgi:1-acyl-sn-glycerol-3-phosphate acyltransferase